MRIQSLIGLASKRNKMGGPFRVWTAAKNLDQPEGSGRVSIEILKQNLKSMNVIPKTMKRWIDQAIDSEIFTEDKSGRFYRYKGVPRAAVTFRAQTVMTAVKLDDPHRLFSTGWLGVVWACFLESLNRDSPTSREVLYLISGVPESTQRYYERQAADLITVYVSATKVGMLAEKNPDKRREILRALRVSQENDSYRLVGNCIVEQLPNVYSITDVNLCKIGRSRKSRKELANLLNKVQQVDDDLHRVYYSTQKSAQKGAERNDRTSHWFIEQDHRGINWYGKIDK